MLGRFDQMEGRIDRIDDNLQTLQDTCNYQWNELHDSYDSDMYDINTHLSSFMMAQRAQTAHFAVTSFQDLRAQIAELEAQKKRDKAAHLEAKRSRRKSSFFRRGSSPLKSTCPRLPPHVCLCFYDDVPLLCYKALRTMLLISMGGVYTYAFLVFIAFLAVGSMLS